MKQPSTASGLALDTGRARRKSTLRPAGKVLAKNRNRARRTEHPTGAGKELRKLRDALDEHAIVAITDPQGKITFVNDKFCAISKYSREELLGQDHRIINSGHHPKKFIRELWATIGRGKVWKGEICNRAKDGSLYWVDTTIVPFLDARGKPREYIAIRADITARKLAEQKALWLASFPERNPNPIVALDPVTEEIYYMNPATSRMFPDLLRKGCRHPLLAGIIELAEDLISGKTDVVHREVLAGGYCLEQTIVYVNDLHRLRLYCTDISERRRAEEEIRHMNADLEHRVVVRTRELEAANKELETFCYSVSHDLRAPLRGIAGFSRVLAETQGAALDETGRNYLGRVLAATDRMGELIDDLLKLSRVSRDHLSPQEVDLSVLARSIVSHLRQRDPGRQVAVHIAEGMKSEGDPRLLRVLMENLLENAWKFTGRKDSPRIEFGVSGTNGHSIFRIADNGAGFDMRYADKLFGPFQRLHSQGEFPGTGIGLATVQRIIHRHGGQIRAESKINEGATFYFTLNSHAPLS